MVPLSRFTLFLRLKDTVNKFDALKAPATVLITVQLSQAT
jgi:hypothetical protein